MHPYINLFHFLLNSFGDADGTGRTDEAAEVTADALGAYQTGTAGLFVEDDGLMAAIATRYLTAPATNTQISVNLRIDNGVAIKMVWIQELLQALAHQCLQLRDAALGHITLHTQYEVVDDAIAVLHDGSAHLHVAATQLDELQGVTPRLNAADAAQL